MDGEGADSGWRRGYAKMNAQMRDSHRAVVLGFLVRASL